MSKIEFLSLEDLLEMKTNDRKFKLVEVLSEDDYRTSHIPGAINIPSDKLEDLAGSHLKRTDTIVVYCASYACQASTKAVRTLKKMGYRKTLDFKAGKRGWTHNGLELEK
jgi:rhodanese-related sulfurtransferase